MTILTNYPGAWSPSDDEEYPHGPGCDCESCAEREDDTIPPSDFLATIPPSNGPDDVTRLNEEVRVLRDRVAALEAAFVRPKVVSSPGRPCYYCGHPTAGLTEPPRCTSCKR